jgi:hypothetical protein
LELAGDPEQHWENDMSTAARSDTVSAPSEQQHFDAARQYQAYYDECLREVGGRAPPPTLGQTVGDYRREVCRRFKRTFLPPIHNLYQVNYRGLRSDALQVFEPQLLQACVQEANNPNIVSPGEFRKIEVRNQYGQLQMTKFIGPERFVKQMGRPGRRVVAFMQSVTIITYDEPTHIRYCCRWVSIFLQAHIRRGLSSLESGAREIKKGRPLVAALCSRALLEDAAVLWSFNREILPLLERRDVDRIDALVFPKVFASRRPKDIEEHGEEFRARNILTAIDKMGAEHPNLRRTYDQLSEICHQTPSACSLILPIHSTISVPYSTTART